MIRFALIIVALLASPVWAKWPHDAVCDVTCRPSMAGGSATLVGISSDGRRGLAISAAHVFASSEEEIECRFPCDGKTRRARLLGVDRAADLAAIDIVSPPDIETPPIVLAAAEDGPYTCVGFPGRRQGEIEWRTGEYMGFPGRATSAWAPWMLHTRTTVTSGYSGGARFNCHGEYVGVVSGMTSPDLDTPMERTWGAAGERLVSFIGRYMKGVDNAHR